jgi:putative cardiolipin synthase
VRRASGPAALHGALLSVALFALAGCATSVKKDFVVEPSHALAYPTDTRIGRNVSKVTADHPGESAFVPLVVGVDAFVARIAAIDAAEKTLDLQYYIVHEGLTTRALVDRLIKAADRGVRVRFLIDDTSSQGNDFSVRMLSAHPNIEVRQFNPLEQGRGSGVGRAFGMLAGVGKLHRRMHNKALIADNAIAVVGGRNLGDEYFGASQETNFADLDLLAAGPVVAEVSAMFDTYWNSPYALPAEAFKGDEPTAAQLDHARKKLADYLANATVARSDYLQRLKTSDLMQRIGSGTLRFEWGRASAVYDDPSKAGSDGVVDPEKRIGPRLLRQVSAAQRELFIVSPYFIPQDHGTEMLVANVKRGVKVTVLTNSLDANDVGMVHDAYTAYRIPLLQGGVGLFELRRKPQLGQEAKAEQQRTEEQLKRRFGSSHASLHTKSIVTDRRTVFVGSMNLDPRSLLWNTELGLVVESPALAERLLKIFEQGLAPNLAYRLELETRGSPPQPKIAWHTREDGKDVVKRSEPASLWTRFSNWFLGVLTPEDLL